MKRIKFILSCLNRVILVTTQFHIDWCLHKKGTFSLGSIDYDCKTYYFINLWRLTISLEGDSLPRLYAR
jgi:hypothetical protein